jgi:hypothetical protein
MTDEHAPAGQGPKVALMWAITGIPLAWGIYNTLIKTAQLFSG